MDNKTKEFFIRLKSQLEEGHQWPAEYLFKFIVPTDKQKIEAVENAFNGMGAVMRTTKSKNATYTSVSINVPMDSPQHVIDKYIELAAIEGIISL
ncbi:MAG: DUF493 family protein [Flavobacterium sp.]|nr:MAG: DUF493 family protein [Flavobacterium sp.]